MTSQPLIVDFSELPLKPINKREIRLLEAALVVGSILTLEIRELLNDPIERVNWMDSVSVAAASMARHAAGMTISEIAMELDRSELLIKSHLESRTTAGKIIARIYEKLVKGELRAVNLDQFCGGEEIERLRLEIERLKSENNTLREKLGLIELENLNLKDVVNRLENETKQLQSTIDSLKAKSDQLEARLVETQDKLKAIRDQLSRIIETINSIIE